MSEHTPIDTAPYLSDGQFVHLRVHTAYSLAEGAIHVKNLIKQCQGLGFPAVAMTDTNNMFGALDFSMAGSGAGVQPIVGVQISLRNTFLPVDPKAKSRPEPDQLVLLAMSRAGYGNLMKLVSKAHLESDALEGPQITLEDMRGFTEDVICLTGGMHGPVNHLILKGLFDEASSCLDLMQDLFGDRLYVELQRHGLEEEEASEEPLLDLAFDKNIPIVATNECFFVGPDMYEAHDALLCIDAGAYVDETDRRRVTPEHRFKSAEEMIDLFKDLPEAIENTLNISKRCHFKVDPIDPLLPNFTEGQDVSEADMLRQESEDGLRQRLDFKAEQEGLTAGKDQDWEKEYWDRLDFELGIINQMGFPGYFLIVADFIQWAKDHDIPVGPGRGSGAGSVVAWVLKITDLDPLRFSLLFERFLNPERVSMPDFDVDFCQDKREEVIKYTQDKYGHDKVAQIITFGKLQARAVVKACGRVMQQPYPVTDRLAKLIPNEPGSALTLAEAVESEERFKAEIDGDPQTALVVDRALKLEGFYAHSSTHAAGVVIGDRPLDELVPLYRDPKSDMPVTQFNMKFVEQAGLVKFDFLGLKTLTVLQRAVHYVAKRDIHIDLEALPLDDRASYDLLASGNTAGVFQLESTGMRAVLKGMRPDLFEDIIAVVALYRPGPMANIPTYVERKHGREKVTYKHPMLESILSETNGIFIYQEQVMELAQKMAGYSLGQADLLRRAMGKKIKEEMDKQVEIFVKGALERGVKEHTARDIFDEVMAFASYGFNKSHAAAYALVAYHTAYMKANFPVEFMAAIMTLDLGNTDKLAGFKQELQRMEVPLLLPDINKSEVAFVVEDAPEDYCEDQTDPRHNLAVRYALGAIKGVGEKAMEAIVKERKENGPYKDMFDFAERIDPKLMNKRQIERLAAAGAFDGICESRAQANAAADVMMRYANMMAAERASDQVSLFGDSTGAEVDRPAVPVVRNWTSTEQLDHERKAIGFYISAHPLDTYEVILERESIISAKEVFNDPGLIGQTVRMAGAILSYRESKSKNTGRKFGALMLSDRTDAFEFLVFEDDLPRTREIVEEGAPIVVNVQIKKRDDDEMVRLSCRGMDSLESLAAQSSGGLEVELGDKSALAPIKAVLSKRTGGRGIVKLKVPVDDDKRFAEFKLPHKYKISPELIQAIEAELGVSSVVEQ